MNSNIIELTDRELSCVHGGASEAGFWGAIAAVATVAVGATLAVTALPALGATALVYVGWTATWGVLGAVSNYGTQIGLNAYGVS